MIEILSSPKRNVEYIRRKNLEDNQLFLAQLRMNHIREDFVRSARSALRKDGNDQTKKCIHHSCERIERNTRYNKKLKAGQITPYVSERQRRLEEKKNQSLEKERRRQALQLEKERKRQALELEKERKRQAYEVEKEENLFRKELKKIERELKREGYMRIGRVKRRQKTSKWTVFGKNHPNQYQRIFKPRCTRVGQRAEQNSFCQFEY